MTNQPSVPPSIKSVARRSLSISQRGTTYLINRVQRGADRATTFNTPRLTMGARSLDYFSSRIAERFPPIGAKYEAHPMAAKPRQELPLAEVNVPSLSPLDVPTDSPAIEPAPHSPYAVTPSASQPGTIQRRPVAPSVAAPAVAASSAAARLQRTTASEEDSPVDRSSLPSITNQLRQMRPATMPKPKEAAPTEPISYNLPPTVQRASEPPDEATPASTIRPTPPSIQADSTPRLRRASEMRRAPRAQITEVTPRTVESGAPLSASAVPEVAQDITPEVTPPTLINSTTMPPATVARSADVPAATSPDTPRLAPLTAPQSTVSTPAMSPRQLSRLFSAVRPSVQRQAESTSQAETTAASQPPTASQGTTAQMAISPEQTRVRRFVETVKHEAQAFTGQGGERGSETWDQGLGTGNQVEAIQRAPEPAQAATEIADTPSAPLTPHLQRTLDETGTIEAISSTISQTESPAIQRTPADMSAPQAASPELDRFTAPHVRPLAAKPSIQRQIVPSGQAVPLSEETAQSISDATPSPAASIQAAAAPIAVRPMLQRSLESSDVGGSQSDRSTGQSEHSDAPKELSDRPKELSDLPKQLSDASKELSDALKQLSDAPEELSDRPKELSDRPKELSDRPKPQIQRVPESSQAAKSPETAHTEVVKSKLEPVSPEIQPEVGPVSTLQRSPFAAEQAQVAPEGDRVVAAAPPVSLTAQLRQRIAAQANQAHETESAPAEGEARLQRLPDLPLIQRAQAGRSDTAEPSAPTPKRRAPATVAPVERIQRVTESAVSSAPANRVQRVEDEAGSSGATIDLDQLARDVYPIVKRLIAIERERRG